MAAVTNCSDFGAQENKDCHCLHCFPVYLPGSDGTGWLDLHFCLLKSNTLLMQLESPPLRVRNICVFSPVIIMAATIYWNGLVTDFIFLDSKITADGDCSHEIKRCLFLGRKAMINLESILKSRDINLLTKVHIIKAMIFPVVMYGCESWTIKKAERRRIDAFELRCWRRLLRVPGSARRSNQSILN